MKEQDFISLIKKYPECLYDEKKFRGILSDLFPHEVQMNNILVNLFHLGLPREIEEVQEINNPIYYKYKKRVVKTYGIDQKLAEDAIRFWCVCYGQKVLGRTINISEIVPDIIGEEPPIGGKKDKTFNNCPFKVTLPQLAVVEGSIKLNFQVQSQKGISVDVSLNETYLSDKLNRKHDIYYMGECKPKNETNKNFALSIPIEKRNFMLSDSVIILYFLSDDQRRYEVSYGYKRGTGAVLEYVMSRKLSSEEILRLEESIRQANEKTKGFEGGGGDSGYSTGNGLGNGDQTFQIPKIEEYKKALFREKFYLQNEGGRRYKLTNGTLINHKNGLSTYPELFTMTNPEKDSTSKNGF